MNNNTNALSVFTKLDDNSKITNSLSAIFSDYEEKLSGIKRIASYVRGEDDLVAYFLAGNDTRSFLAKEIFKQDGAVAALNAEFWSKAIEMTDVLECMPATQRNEWSDMIHKRKTPDFTKENVIPTLQNLLLSRESFLAKKVDGIFRSLSGNHVTNSPQGFRARMIIEYVINSYGHLNHDKVEYLHDLRAIIAKLNGRDSAKTYITRCDLEYILREERFGEWFDFDGGAFRVKLFKKGTAHMEVHPDVAIDLNNVLATLYPNAIPAYARNKDAKEKHIVLQNDLLDPEVIKELSDVLDKISRRNKTAYIHKADMSKNVYDGVFEVLSFIGGIENNSSWSFNYNAVDVLATIIRTGCIPNKKSHQYYPTQETLANLVVDLADIDQYDRILEPSAGQGGIADLLPKNRTTCVEISEVNATVLKSKGFEVIEADFLKTKFNQKFTKIVMNPPFDKGQAERHLKRATSLLEKDGKLVAVLPASLVGKELIDGMKHTWTGIIEGAFEDTGVRVAVLTLENKE